MGSVLFAKGVTANAVASFSSLIQNMTFVSIQGWEDFTCVERRYCNQAGSFLLITGF